MNSQEPFFYSGHHVSDSFCEFASRVALTDEQRRRYSDFSTGLTMPQHGWNQVSTHSRGVIDLNRSIDNPTLFAEQDFDRPQRNRIWLPGQELTSDEKQRMMREVYEPYHNRLLDVLVNSEQRSVFIGWDDTADYTIGVNPDGTERRMPNIVLSNNGDRNVGGVRDPEHEKLLTCDPDFLEELGRSLSREMGKVGLNDEVQLNTYDDEPHDECGNNPNIYNTVRQGNSLAHARNPVHAIQVEANTAITHNDLTPDKALAEKFRLAFERAMTHAYREVLLAKK